MACGRRKNLEIAARNPLCSFGDRRRNFLTTRDGNRRRGNPEPPGKGQLRALGPGEVRRHRQGGNSEPPVRGKPRATRYWANFGASGLGESPVPPGKGETRKGNLGPPAQGKLQGTWRRGNPEPRAEKKALSHPAQGKLPVARQRGNPESRDDGESSGPPAQGGLQVARRRGNPESRDEKEALGHRRKGKLQGVWRRGNPESCAEKKALSHRRRGKLEPFDLGETPVIW